MRLTKKAFEDHNNGLHGVTPDRSGNGRYGASSRPYGTYLCHQDPEKFNIEYEDWREKQSGAGRTI